MALTAKKLKKKTDREKELKKIKALEKENRILKRKTELQEAVIESLEGVNRVLSEDDEAKKLLWTTGFPHNVKPEVAEKIQSVLKKTQKDGDGSSALLKRVLVQDNE